MPSAESETHARVAGDTRHFAPIDFKTRFPALDGIRALAVTLVFAAHFGGGSHGGAVLRLINEVRERGWIGVDIFFVLSGFLITGILYDTRRDSRFFARFFGRRAVRIFPVFYLVGAVLLLLTPVFHYQWHWLQLTFLVYLGNFWGNHNFELYTLRSATNPTADVFLGHLWSLCVEEQFYLLWPLAVWFIRDRVRLIQTAAAFSLLALALRIIMVANLPANVAETWIIRTLPFRLDDLLFGAMLALLLRGPHADRIQRSSKWLLLIGLAASVAIFIASPEYDSPWLLTVGLSAIGLASTGLIGITLRANGPAFRLFHLKPLRILGKYSYGFYIFHVLYGWAWIVLLTKVIARVHSIALGGLIVLPLSFLTTFVAAKLSYDLFEVRFLKLKRHFEYDSELSTHKHAFTTK